MSDGCCEECGSDALFTAITSTSTTDADAGSGIYLIWGELLRNPDTIEVELNCSSCKHARLLDATEWEVT